MSLAGENLTIEVRPGEGRHELRRPNSSPASADREPLPIAGPVGLDIDGTGTLRDARETLSLRYARILPDVPGYQQVTWNETWTTAKICRLQLFAFDQGYDKPRLVWKSEPEADVFMPLCVVDDIDADGVQEICVATHYRVMIYEGTTGRKETELRYHSSRNYGWFGLVDVDADGQQELITLADFQSHFDVLNYDPALPEPDRLSVRWRRDIEEQIERRERWPQIGPRPLADVTGDGLPEIVVNLFNEHGDEQWHVVVLDARDGSLVVDLPRRYGHGTADLNRGGRAEAFVTRTAGAVIPEFGRIELVRVVDSGHSEVVWAREDARFGLADEPHYDAHWATGATWAMRDILSGGFRGAVMRASAGPPKIAGGFCPVLFRRTSHRRIRGALISCEAAAALAVGER